MEDKNYSEIEEPLQIQSNSLRNESEIADEDDEPNKGPGLLDAEQDDIVQHDDAGSNCKNVEVPDQAQQLVLNQIYSHSKIHMSC